MSQFIRTRCRVVAATIVAVTAMAACSSDAAPQSTPSASDAPVAAGVTDTAAAAATNPAPLDTGSPSVAAANGEVTLKAIPQRIVSLSPTQTEILFAIGAGSQVVAVDDQSNFPAEAAAVTSSLSGFTPNIEAIAGYEPDLVVIADDADGMLAQLTNLGIPVWSGPAPTTLDGAYEQIEQLGVLTGHTAQAVQVTGAMQSEIAAIVADLPKLDAPLTYYHELDSTYFSSTSNTFIGAIYALAGLVNIADTAESGNDYPQLSAEFIVSANPDLIFLADSKCCAQTPETVASRDGWSGIAAVKNGQVVTMDDDIASRWGPRVVEYLRAVAAAVDSAASVSTGG